jgi:hypothetical protein
MKRKLLYMALPALVVIVVFSYAYFASGTAIVDATVLNSYWDENAALRPSIWFSVIVNATKAYPDFPLVVKSDCNQTIGTHLFVGVKISSEYQGYKPVSHDAQLFKEGGPLNIGFVPWNGC